MKQGIFAVVCILLTGSLSCVESGPPRAANPAQPEPRPAQPEPVAPPAQPAEIPNALEAMIASERAFAKAAEDTSIRDAFIAYLSGDSILFAPGPVNGRQHWQNRPAPPPREAGKARPVSLLWAPVLGDISAAGDMGYSTGPYILRDNTGKAPDSHGLFFSIWKKRPSGAFLVALDIGVPTPQAAHGLGDVFQRASGTAPSDPAAASASSAADLTKLDTEFAAVSASRPGQAFQTYFAASSRLHHSGILPLSNKQAVVAHVEAHFERYAAQPAFADMASSHDFGYTYGTYQLVEKAKGGSPEDGHYTHAWRLLPEGWKIVAAVMAANENE